MSDLEPIELRTHTRLWQVEKKLYKLYDYTLPMPISLRMIGILFGICLPWFFVMGFLGVPFSPPIGYMFWLVPPAMLSWAANKPVAEGKRLTEFMASQFSYFMRQHRVFVRLAPHQAPETVHVRAEVWRPYDTAIPISDAPPGQEFRNG